ncbi:MAG TPA: hypothetical protein VFU02_23705 [Polyangiaceae bacterium]|nr:hypothetical protein [Polyangiaceae bacterium]
MPDVLVPPAPEVLVAAPLVAEAVLAAASDAAPVVALALGPVLVVALVDVCALPEVVPLPPLVEVPFVLVLAALSEVEMLPAPELVVSGSVPPPQAARQAASHEVIRRTSVRMCVNEEKRCIRPEPPDGGCFEPDNARQRELRSRNRH